MRGAHLQELEADFSEVEKRIRALVHENAASKARIRELEQELAAAQLVARDMDHVRGKQHLIREKVERILLSLESMETKK